MAFLGSASGQLIATDAGGDVAGQMTVSVVPASALAASARPDRSGGLRPLLSQYSDQAPVALDPNRPDSDMSRLLQRVQGAAPADRPAQGDADRSAEPSDASDPTPSRTLAGAAGRKANSPAPNPGSTGGLWGAVEPCWRDVAGGSAVPVTLDVAIDLQGELTTPPRIIRNAGDALDERRLLAEARALSALAACMPHGDLRFSGKRYRLEFLPRK